MKSRLRGCDEECLRQRPSETGRPTNCPEPPVRSGWRRDGHGRWYVVDTWGPAPLAALGPSSTGERPASGMVERRMDPTGPASGEPPSWRFG
jgi:hypothetical protein